MLLMFVSFKTEWRCHDTVLKWYVIRANYNLTPWLTKLSVSMSMWMCNTGTLCSSEHYKHNTCLRNSMHTIEFGLYCRIVYVLMSSSVRKFSRYERRYSNPADQINGSCCYREGRAKIRSFFICIPSLNVHHN